MAANDGYPRRGPGIRNVLKDCTMKKITVLAMAGGAMVNFAAMAAAPGGFTISPDGRTVTVSPAVNTAAAQNHRPQGNVLFDNFASLDPKGVYTVGSGAGFGDVTTNAPPVELAAAFTASRTTSVTEIDVGAGFISGKRNMVLVHLYQDAGGVPGTEIWSHATALPVDGTCCDIAALVLKTQDVKLVAGQQYWVGLGVTKGAAGTFAAWYGNVADQVDAGLTAINQGEGWAASPTVPLPAFAVFGN
jgi:hypothetical protein